MPFRSEKQRKLFYAKSQRGEISKKTVQHWESATTNKHLPERVKKHASYVLGSNAAMKKLGLILFLLLIPSIAFAASDEPQVWWQVLLTNLVNLLVLLGTPVVLMLSHRLVKIIEKKTGVDVDERQEALLDAKIEQAIAYAQEQAHKALKAGKPLSSADKHSISMEYLNGAAKDTSPEALAKRVEAKLNSTRPPK